MTIPPPIAANTLILSPTPGVVRGWTVGQILAATVLEVVAEGKAMLQIGTQRVSAEMRGAVVAGEKLDLKVTQLGARPVLTRLPAPQAGTPQPEARQSVLRSTLPRQAPMPPLLANLVAVARDAVAAARILPPAAAVQIKEVVAALRTPQELSLPQGLKQAIADAGIFLESRLATGAADNATPRGGPATDLGRDFKAALMRLAETLAAHVEPEPPPANAEPDGRAPPPPMRHTPPAAQPPASPSLTTISGRPAVEELAGQVSAALARVELHQLNSMPAPDQPTAVWLFELPVRDRDTVDVLQLRIEEEHRKRKGESGPYWAVTLAADLEGIGPLYARVSLNGRQVHTTLWAERADTLALIRAHDGWLRAQLEQAGLEVVEINCLPGAPCAPPAARITPLVDVQI